MGTIMFNKTLYAKTGGRLDSVPQLAILYWQSGEGTKVMSLVSSASVFVWNSSMNIFWINESEDLYVCSKRQKKRKRYKMENTELGPTGLDRQTDPSWQYHEFTKVIN